LLLQETTQSTGGKNNSGKRKIQYAEEIAKKINDASVRVKQDKDKVKAKISHIEDCFRSAYDWANTENGAGMKENDESTFKDQMC
jgi:ribosomal protein L2